jgi:N-acetylglucosaminyldiphosphoundecaprenol N-acetyl-beta-D-mannosaminyltransferase
MLRLQELDIVESKEQLALIPEGKVLINTIYAYSYVVAQRDDLFAQALVNCDYLMPD